MRARHAVVHQRAGERLAGIVDHELLPQRLADALHDGAMGLAVDDERIDAAADVVHAGIAREREPAAVGVDLDFADRAAVREYRIVHFVVGDDGKPAGEIVGQREFRDLLRQFEEIEAAVGLARGKAPVVELDVLGRGAERERGDALAFGDEIGRGNREHGGGMAHGTAGMRAAAGAHHVGVAHDDADALERDLQQIRHDLREARLMALPGRLGADDDVDAALGLDGDARLFLGRADRGLDVIGEAEAEQTCRASWPRAGAP